MSRTPLSGPLWIRRIPHVRLARIGALGAAALAAACADAATGPGADPAPAEFANYSVSQQVGGCGLGLDTRLLAGQTIAAGRLSLWNDESNLYVRFRTSGDWRLHRTHLAVATSLGGIPVNGPGNPAPGRFQFQQAHSPAVTEHVFTIPLTPSLVAGPLFLAAHAEVATADGSRGESAWAEGTRFTARGNWAMYVGGFRLQGCTGEAVVVGDANLFDELGMQNAGNRRWVQNLVSVPTTGPRDAGRTVWFDRGRGSACAAASNRFGQPNYEPCDDTRLATMRSVISQAGYGVVDRSFAVGEMTAIPAEVKTIFFWTPRAEQAFSLAEINLLKRFVAEGGRVVYVSEWQLFYGDVGVVATGNTFLQNFGTAARNVGAGTVGEPVHECASYVFENPRQPAWPPKSISYPVTTSLGTHAFMAGVESIKLACSSAVQDLGAGETALIRDRSGQHVLAASVRLSTKALDQTPVIGGARFSLQTARGAVQGGLPALYVGGGAVKR